MLIGLVALFVVLWAILHLGFGIAVWFVHLLILAAIVCALVWAFRFITGRHV